MTYASYMITMIQSLDLTRAFYMHHVLAMIEFRQSECRYKTDAAPYRMTTDLLYRISTLL
jgi:hypothetical protein